MQRGAGQVNENPKREPLMKLINIFVNKFSDFDMNHINPKKTMDLEIGAITGGRGGMCKFWHKKNIFGDSSGP